MQSVVMQAGQFKMASVFGIDGGHVAPVTLSGFGVCDGWAGLPAPEGLSEEVWSCDRFGALLG